MKKNRTAYIAILLVSIIVIATVFSLDPMAQDPGYHNFTDQRLIMGIPNFWNVVSNIPFLLVGIMGIYNLYYSDKIKIINDMKLAYALFFTGVAFVSIGSSYYHLWPDNSSLVFDRLPMTIAFMSLFSIIAGELISKKLGKILLLPLIITGIISVLHWFNTESQGEGDLRLYILVQFLPVILIPLILLSFKGIFTTVKGYWFLLGAYLLAKLLEHYDSDIYDALIFISGHSLKHVAAALGIYLLLISYQNRTEALTESN